MDVSDCDKSDALALNASAIDPSKKVETLSAEARDVSTRATSYLVASERLLATTLVLFVLAGTVAVTAGRPIFLIALPFALAVPVAYAVFFNNEALLLSGYRQALEDKLEYLLDEPLVVYEQVVGSAFMNRPQKYSLLIMVGLSYIAAVVAAIVQAFATRDPSAIGHGYSGLWIALTVISVLVSASCLTWSFVTQGPNRHASYMACRARLGLSGSN